MDHCRVTVSITSTVLSLLSPSPRFPATTRDLPLHTTTVTQRLVGMGGNCFVHLLSVRLSSELVTSSFGVSPPMAVRRLLIIARLNRVKLSSINSIRSTGNLDSGSWYMPKYWTMCGCTQKTTLLLKILHNTCSSRGSKEKECGLEDFSTTGQVVTRE